MVETAGKGHAISATGEHSARWSRPADLSMGERKDDDSGSRARVRDRPGPIGATGTVDFTFTAEENSFRQEVRAFLDAELPPDKAFNHEFNEDPDLWRFAFEFTRKVCLLYTSPSPRDRQ